LEQNKTFKFLVLVSVPAAVSAFVAAKICLNKTIAPFLRRNKRNSITLSKVQSKGILCQKGTARGDYPMRGPQTKRKRFSHGC